LFKSTGRINRGMATRPYGGDLAPSEARAHGAMTHASKKRAAATASDDEGVVQHRIRTE
jgi:hypothetical protein